MFETPLPSPRDLARRAALRQLQTSAPVAPSSAFRVRAWRWHHLGVVRDLRRVERGLSSRRARLCPTTGAGGSSARAQLLDALRYIVHDNWRLHNTVEATLFLPWLRSAPALANDTRLRRGERAVAEERCAVEKEADAVLRAAQRWVDVSPRACGRELGGLRERVRKLRESAELLFSASEAVFIPRVVRVYSEKEQLRFNDTVLKNISGRQARVSLVIFGDAVGADDPVVATARDRKDFESDIPAPIRKLAMPYWRRKFVAQRIRFLLDGDEEKK